MPNPAVHLHVFATPRSSQLRPAIYFMHGGGMVMGSACQSRAALWKMAVENDAVVVSVEYRLAPETTFPGPLEDCYAGLQWLYRNASSLGIDGHRIVLLGESAGGGLAASLALLARDRAEVPIRAQILTYPMLDHRTGGLDDPYRNATTGHFVWTREHNQFGWRSLQGQYDLTDGHTGYYSAARASRRARGITRLSWCVSWF
jgi:acetyl esterase/lipase